MIGTGEIKKQQLTNGSFKIGSGSEVILIMGSCRSIPYLNYLNLWNKSNRFTIHFIDPFNWNWNIKDERVDYPEIIERLEGNQVILDTLSSVKIFIHEYYRNFGMFNTEENGEKNIYDFGMNPDTDICIPNFNDLFILFNDIVTFDPEIKERAIVDYKVHGNLSEETCIEIYNLGQRNLEKFYSICLLSDVPEMKEYFKDNFKTTRFFWTSNHVSKDFTLSIFRFINKFLNLDLSESFWNEISKDDMYANNYVYLTKYDLKYYGIEWGEDVKELNI